MKILEICALAVTGTILWGAFMPKSDGDQAGDQIKDSGVNPDQSDSWSLWEWLTWFTENPTLPLAIAATIVAVMLARTAGKELVKPLTGLIPLLIIGGLLVVWLGRDNTAVIGKNISNVIIEATDGDGVISQADDPTISKVYGGSTQAPELVAAPLIGNSKSYEIDGPIRFDVPVKTQLCPYWKNGTINADYSNVPEFLVLEPTGKTASLSIETTRRSSC